MHSRGAPRRPTFRGRIAHGAYQVGLASALVGMYLPGKNCLLGSVNARFPAPLRFPTRVKVRGEVAAWNREQLAGQLKAVVLDKAAVNYQIVFTKTDQVTAADLDATAAATQAALARHPAAHPQVLSTSARSVS